MESEDIEICVTYFVFNDGPVRFGQPSSSPLFTLHSSLLTLHSHLPFPAYLTRKSAASTVAAADAEQLLKISL